MIRYPSVEDVIALNRELAGAAGGVRDRGLVESAVFRPQQGFGGVEAHPTIWDKAAALLHGLAATQGFQDGNKRTAWVATETFLEENGHPLQLMPDVVAQAFALAASTSSLDLPRIAEWLQHYEETEPPANRRHPQLDYAFLAHAGTTDEDGTFNALRAQTGGLATGSELPLPLSMSVVCRIFWTPDDVGREHDLTVQMTPEGGGDSIGGGGWSLAQPVHGGHAHHPHGLMPTIAALQVFAWVERVGRYEVRLHLDGAPLAVLPLDIAVSPLLA